ncbi:MAG: 30S ribosomal protein S16 [Chlamydiae bacterium]|nr:30S ribosomal protein S16 [Chlamydiota bacterium]
MALKIRLRQQGRTNHTTYRLVVTDTRHPRDGKYIEKLGWSRPFDKVGQSAEVNGERVAYWLGQGAQISDNAKLFVAKNAPAVMKEYQQSLEKKKQKICEKRRERRKGAKLA